MGNLCNRQSRTRECSYEACCGRQPETLPTNSLHHPHPLLVGTQATQQEGPSQSSFWVRYTKIVLGNLNKLDVTPGQNNSYTDYATSYD